MNKSKFSKRNVLIAILFLTAAVFCGSWCTPAPIEALPPDSVDLAEFEPPCKVSAETEPEETEAPQETVSSSPAACPKDTSATKSASIEKPKATVKSEVKTTATNTSSAPDTKTDAPEVKETPTEAEEEPVGRTINVVATAYTHTGKQTSTQTWPEAGRTIAVDPRVIPYGSRVLINGHEYIAEDCGGAIKGNRIDIFMDTKAECDDWGIKPIQIEVLE